MKNNSANSTKPDAAALSAAPHGAQQNIKMNLLKWLNEGRDPFEIIGYLAEYLEETSAEPGFAQIVKDDIQNVYGQGFGNPSVLGDELSAVRSRLVRLKKALANVKDDETTTRLKFAIEHHEKRIKELEQVLQSDK